jgi:hypothetical protein
MTSDYDFHCPYCKPALRSRENLRVQLATDRFHQPTQQFGELTKGDSSDDKQINIAVRLLAKTENLRLYFEETSQRAKLDRPVIPYNCAVLPGMQLAVLG